MDNGDTELVTPPACEPSGSCDGVTLPTFGEVAPFFFSIFKYYVGLAAPAKKPEAVLPARMCGVSQKGRVR